MKVCMKMHRVVYERMQLNLRSAHAFAAERVGFLSARLMPLDGGDKLILLNDFWPVADHHYIPDPEVGARISGEAIREAMQRILDTGDGAFHVHPHRDHWPLGFSPSDHRGYGGLLPALRAVGRSQSHGAVILNSESVCGIVYLPESNEAAPVSKLSVVGFPSLIFGGTSHE